MTLIEKNILYHVIHGVEIEILNYKSDYVGIQYAKSNGYYFLNNTLYITYEGGSTGKSLESCKLMLKSFTDLFGYPTDNLLYDFIQTCLADNINVFNLPKEIVTCI